MKNIELLQAAGIKNICIITNIFYWKASGLKIKIMYNIIEIVDDDDFCMINAPQKIYLQNEKGEKTDIGFRYHPGNLSISKEDYEKIKSFDGKIEMHFGWDKHLIGETRHYFYDIPLEKRLFEQAYVIIKIYNMDD